jgi:hypothetical protein
MDAVGPDHIDYWQGVCAAQSGQTSSFGIRVQDGRCSAVKRIDGGQSNIFGTAYQIPVQLEILPTYLRMIIDSHLLSYPTSDLMDVLTGEKSFQDASVARMKMEEAANVPAKCEEPPPDDGLRALLGTSLARSQDTP